MGEYAVRKSDGAEIKIGTCESMYYIRFEDRHKVRALSGNVNLSDDKQAGECRFRLPFPDEDGKQPGEYEDYNRGLRLYKMLACKWCVDGKRSDGLECFRCHGSGTDGHEEFTDEEAMSDIGLIQLRHEQSGLLVNVPCYHGMKLPDVGDKCQAFWNGKGWSLELSSLRAVYADGELQVFPVVACRHCNQAWRYEWSKVWDYISPDMQAKLAKYRPVAV